MKNTDKYHGMSVTQLQSEIYKLDTQNEQLVKALRDVIRYELYLGDHPQRQAAFDSARDALANVKGD